MADTKWSQFPSATPGNSDEVVGLHSGDNARFSIANIVAAVRNGLANIFVPKTDVGAAGGVAELDSTGKVPSTQLPPIASTAADVTYDNTGSGLTADDVQEAIDELAQGGGGGGTTVIANPSGEATDSLDKLQVENTIYQIPVGGKPINYSTDEKYTGQKWVDGKKIYQKTLAIKRTDLQDSTLTTSNVAGFIYLTENYPMIWIDESASVLFHPTTTDGVTAQPVNYDGGSTLTRLNIARAPGRNNGKQYIYFQTTYWTGLFYNSDAWTLYITIKYTKTSDTPTPPGGLYVDADEVTFDPTDSGLTATDVQGAVDELAEDKANQVDLTNIRATGTTNTTGAAIPAGTYFYLNGILYRAKTQINQNATFTVNTNCEQVSEGGLNELKTAIFTPVAVSVTAGSGFSIIRNSSYRIGNIIFLSVRVQATTAHSGTGNYVICTSLPKPLLDSGSGGGTWAYFGTGDDAARRFSLVYSFVGGVAMGEIVAADKAWAVDDKFAFSVVYLANISV